jgi:outer membrane protein OmpA-like peptidoglycan-associated protein
MNRFFIGIAMTLLLSGAAVAQKQTAQQALSQGQMNLLMSAQQALTAAEQAGAQQSATSLYDDAAWRLKFAQENWSAGKEQTRDDARLRAEEALWAARAALAKTRWIGTNTAIRSLQTDITRLGGTANTTLIDESPSLQLDRGATTRARIDFAQAAVDQARAVGAEQIDGNELKPAQQNLDTARKIAQNAKQSSSADHLAYVAEMMGRRAYYLARGNETVRYVPNLQMERTRLAQADSERRAAADRAQREAAERASADLRRQLAAEQANREAQAAEVDRLRAQVEDNRKAVEARIEADRQARTQAEQALDEMRTRYQTAIASGNTNDIETLRRQVEDQQISLRTVQERERLNEQAMSAEIEGLRTDLSNSQTQGTVNAQVLADRQAELNRRQAELEQMRKDREADLVLRTQREHDAQLAIAEATNRRQAAEAQAQAMQRQVQEAQASAQQAQLAAQQNAAELERTRQQAQATQAELDRTRQQLADREAAEARRLQLQTTLNKIATTRNDTRGLIVTLPGRIFFDTGKSTLKAGSKNTLTKLANALKNESGFQIAVEGHTDNVGSETSNQTLSEKRANAVRSFLVGAGIADSRISAAGKGEAEPVATNKTEAGRQENRRVELVITQQ